MVNVAFAFGLIAFVLCIKLSTRLTKIERILNQSEFGTDKTKSLYNILVKNMGKKVTLTFSNGDSIFGDKKINCQILDIDNDWILLKEMKKDTQQLLHIGSVRNVRI